MSTCEFRPFFSSQANCSQSATWVRYWVGIGIDIRPPSTMLYCEQHAVEWQNMFGAVRGYVRLLDGELGYVLPLIQIEPWSELHLAMEMAWYALACGGVYTPVELRAMNTELREKRLRAEFLVELAKCVPEPDVFPIALKDWDAMPRIEEEWSYGVRVLGVHGYPAFEKSFLSDPACCGQRHPTMFMAVTDDRETWYIWHSSTLKWTRHQSTETLTERRARKDLSGTWWNGDWT